MKELVASQRKYFNVIRRDIAGVMESAYAFRKANLLRLKDGLVKHEKKMLEALREDLGKSAFESVMTETAIVHGEISFILKHLKSWMKPKRIRTPFVMQPAGSKIYYEPYGVALIISPWNYPIQLPLSPLAASIAAGNCSIVKLSELSLNSSSAVKEMLDDTFQPCYVSAVTGSADVAGELLQQQFDYILFTGSPRVGKIVMKAAAENLTPVTLELGGKSPCIVEQTADLDIAAKRIVWGKLLNAGQTCIAPDYILAHKNIRDKLVKKMIFYIEKFYSDKPLENGAYPKMINKDAFDRVVSLIDSAKTVYGGMVNEESLKIEPTIMVDINEHDKIMEEEIFGPILPVITYENINEAEDFILSRPKPLAFYAFTNNKRLGRKLVEHLSFGSGCINDTVIHVASNYLPFGGVGNSGMGHYHGKYSFETFSHMKGVMERSTSFDIPLRYHPVGNKLKYIKKILEK